MTWRDADVISSGRDPDRPAWPPERWWRLAAVAAVLVIGGGVTAGVLLAGGPAPGRRAAVPHAIRSRVVPALLSGVPAGPDAARGTALLLSGTGGPLRMLSVTGRGAASLRWATTTIGVPSPLRSNPSVQSLQPVSGGFVALLDNETGCCQPVGGHVFFIPVTARGAAAPRLIAHADHLAVAPGGQDIWVQQGGPPGDTWLIDPAGRRLSPVLRLRRKILLAATPRGLLTGSARGRGVRLISTATGTTVSMRVPPGALLAAVSRDEVAWQSPPCARLTCPLHVTSLLTGTDTVIPLPLGTQTNGQPGAFDQPGNRLALTLDTISRKNQPAATHIYVIGIASRRITQLPGGPLPLTQAATMLGAITGAYSGFNTVSWPDGPDLWIVASGPPGFQAAYWPGTGPLRLLSPQPGQIFGFAVSTP